MIKPTRWIEKRGGKHRAGAGSRPLPTVATRGRVPFEDRVHERGRRGRAADESGEERVHSGMGEHMQIGEVAERTGLSLRTIRYYEEVGLVTPSTRSEGGFRLYAESDVERLQLAKQMKPLGFQLEEMRELLAALDPQAGEPDADEAERSARLRRFSEIAEERCLALRAQLETAEGFAAMLKDRIARSRAGAR